MFLPFMPLRGYAQFYGRASRWEFWGFVIVAIFAYPIITSSITYACYHLFGKEMLEKSVYSDPNMEYYAFSALLTYLIFRFAIIPYALALLVPFLAVLVRRLHDQDRSAWWLLILLLPYVGIVVILVMLCIQGTVDSNRFGPSAGIQSESSTFQANKNSMVARKDDIIDAEWSEVE